jgi:chromosomal replication initiator protein
MDAPWEPLAETCLETLLADLTLRIGTERFELWFAGKARWEVLGQTLRISAASRFAAGWMRSRFLSDIGAAAAHALGRTVSLQIMVDAAGPALPARRAPRVADAAHAEDPRRHIAGSIAPDTFPPKTAAQAAASAGGGAFAGALPGGVLNPRYTLDEFVVGACNQMAYQAAVRVAAEPGRHFNPLFIHGPCGLGKTHLLQGICQRFGLKQPGRKWLYLTGEQFTNDFVEAIRTHKTEAFRRRIRSADLLIIDDVHFLAHKKATQEEFLHTFNQIDAGGKQVVLASDCPPKAIASMTENLISRFVSGMVVRVDAPDLATRLEILKRKVARNHWSVSDAMLMHLAQQPTSSVRELEGSLMQVVAGASLMGDVVAAANGADSPLGQRQAIGNAPLAMDCIVTAVATHFDISPAQILGSSREKLLSLARALAMYLARQHTAMSYPEIGRGLGNKNHSTVIAACQRIAELMRGGELVCWQTKASGKPEPRHQAITEIVHELTTVLRKK